MKENKNKVSLYNRWLNGIEKIGNSLPHPIILFAMFAAAIVVLSAVCAVLGVSATGNLVVNGELQETTVTAVSLLTKEGLTYMLTNAVTNFTTYAPLGMVLVAMLGVGVAEHSGLINALLKGAVKITPAKLITPAVIFLGVMSNIASDAGYVILIPLGAMIFRAYGRHPMAGLAAAFAGVSGGFSANLLIGTLDPMLAGISQTAVSIIDPGYEVSVMGNYFFLFVSTFLITILGTFITDKVVEPRLGTFTGEVEGEDDSLTTLTDGERKGLRNAGIAALIFVAVIVAACIPADSFMRNENGAIFGNPTSTFVNGIVIMITFLFMIPGVVYGKTVGTFTKENGGACKAMEKSMSSMGAFLALAFVSAQFINYFSYTKLGTIIALAGASFFENANIGLIPLMIIFVLFSAFMNLFMGSASAKWNILAPVFVPMFMLLGYSPELCQLAYRIGDSSTNIITPLMTYFAVIIVFAQKYDKKAGIGTITATMVPYSVAFLIGWTFMLIVWLLAGLPIGPGIGIYYSM
ncbi:MAG: AbgT family transporter [Lachnospiraceae bacterium]|nr:AbgT family transporter [Lachnospiraceae bacterium]